LLALAQERNIPLDVSIELTHHCNFRCRHCFVPDFTASDRLSTERVLTLLDELVEMGTLGLTLTGGEVLLRPDWLRIARRARRLGFALRLFTNGALIDEDTAEAIRGLKAVVEISLHAMREEVFETITGRTGSFRKTLSGIEFLRQRGVEVVLKTTVQLENRADLSAVAAYAAEVGATHQAFGAILPKKDGNLGPIGFRLPPSELKSLLLPVVEEGFHMNRETPLCAAATRYCAINSAGDVLACNIMPGSGGNLRNRSFREIWEGSPWLNTVRGIRVKDLNPCNTCDRLSYCGRCHAQALMEHGDLYGPSSYARERAEVIECIRLEQQAEGS
jgi:radical SAM protein with 4Fe4S-binding SPASM domain